MRKIELLDLPSENPEFVFMTNSLDVSESSVQERINSESEGSLIRRPAIVDMLDLRWFFAERKNFVSFALLLD